MEWAADDYHNAKTYWTAAYNNGGKGKMGELDCTMPQLLCCYHPLRDVDTTSAKIAARDHRRRRRQRRDPFWRRCRFVRGNWQRIASQGWRRSRLWGQEQLFSHSSHGGVSVDHMLDLNVNDPPVFTSSPVNTVTGGNPYL